MQNLVHESFFEATPEQLFALHERPEALRRLSPPFPPVKSLEQDGPFEAGTTVRIEIGVGVLALTWEAELELVEPGRRFVDVQRSGPFRSWRHEHHFIDVAGGSVMRDEVTWQSVSGLALIDEWTVRPALGHYFRKRHAALDEWVREEYGRNE